MSENVGVVVTISEMYAEVRNVSAKLDSVTGKLEAVESLQKSTNELESRLRKIEAQSAAHWVVHGLLMGAIALGIERLFI